MQLESTKKSLYEQLGGEPAVNAAVDLFYKKVLNDERINHFFTHTDMDKLINKQKEFMTYAFGGHSRYEGQSLRMAHKDLDLIEDDFNAVAECLNDTLEELNVPIQLQAEVMTIVGSTKADILNM